MAEVAIPIIHSITPSIGPTSGGDLIRIIGEGFSKQISVSLGDAPALLLGVREEAGLSVADLRSPEHSEELVDVVLQNLDIAGAPILGELITLANAYRFQRPRIIKESNLTRVIRRLLQVLKAQILQNTSLTVSMDYDDAPDDELHVIAMASLPSLILSGPTLIPDRFYATNISHEEVVPGLAGPELLRRRPSYTVDLRFTLTLASERTAELFNLMAVVASFFNANKWLELPRDSGSPDLGSVRWEMEPEGDFRSNLRGRGDVRVFNVGLIIRGFDVDEGLPRELSKAIQTTELEPITSDLNQEPHQ